jgi:hypothetical protein
VVVGVGVSEGVAGTGVNVARRVAVGLGVWVDVAGAFATAVDVGGWSIRPHPVSARLVKAASHTNGAIPRNAPRFRQSPDPFNSSLPWTRRLDGGQNCNKRREESQTVLTWFDARPWRCYNPRHLMEGD